MNNKKILIVYYSRGGKTRKAAEYLCQSINCTIEEIIDTKNRTGFFGLLNSTLDSMRNKLTTLNQLKNNPSDFDLVILGTPIWASHISTPIKTFITENKANIKRVAVFSTQGSSSENNAFADISNILGDKPLTSLTISSKQLKGDGYKYCFKDFIKTLKSYL